MWLEYARSNRYKLLLITLMTCFIIVPTVFELSNLYESKYSQWLIACISALLLISAAFAISDNRDTKYFSVALMLVSLFIEVLSALLTTSYGVAIVHHCLRIVFFGYIIIELLKSLFRPTVVTFDTISASLCVYLLIGALWAHFYSMCEIFVPNSVIAINRMAGFAPIHDNDMTRSFRMLYFSLVTLSTVGYGDVIPHSPMTRMLAVSEAIIGQLYLLVMVSRLVGIHVAQALAPVVNKD